MTVPDPSGVCYVVLAHQDPDHIKRLTAALAPSPVVLHCDARADDATFAAMTASPRVTPVARRATPWASPGIAYAELDSIRHALTIKGWAHLVVLQGSDHPIVASSTIEAELGRRRGRSIGTMEPLPRAVWRGHGGFDRLRYRHWAWRKHMLRLPVRRRLPRGIVASGGSVNKVLAREHAELLIAFADRRPDLARFWRRAWAADETLVHTLLLSALHDAGRSDEVERTSLWYYDWGNGRQKSPAWLTTEHIDDVRVAALKHRPMLFARKFHTDLSGDVLDAVDEWRHQVATPA